MSAWIYVLYMCCIMWDCKLCMALWLYWLCVYSVRDMMISDWYIHVWYDLIMALYIRILWEAAWLEFLYVVLNTTYNCIRCYIVWILVLCYTVMCVYVDNYVDNFNINVDNFFVAFATLLRTFLKILYFRVFSHIISCYLLFALVFSLFHYIAITHYIVYTI